MKRSAAARCTACPPATEPVKATKSTRASRITRSVSACSRCSNWNTPGGQSGGREAFGEALGAQRRLRRMLEQHDVAGHERGHHAVDGDQVREIPGGDREHHAERLAPEETVEVRLAADVDVGERGGRDADHVARALERAAHLVGRVAQRPAHLPAELGRELGGVRLEGRTEALHEPRTLRHRHDRATATAPRAHAAARLRSAPRWRWRARRIHARPPG